MGDKLLLLSLLDMEWPCHFISIFCTILENAPTAVKMKFFQDLKYFILNTTLYSDFPMNLFNNYKRLTLTKLRSHFYENDLIGSHRPSY